MSVKSMDVFSRRDSIVEDYKTFATSFTPMHAEDIRSRGDAIYSEGRFSLDPLLRINLSYKRRLNLKTLIANGALDPRTAEIFRADGAPLFDVNARAVLGLDQTLRVRGLADDHRVHLPRLRPRLFNGSSEVSHVEVARW